MHLVPDVDASNEKKKLEMMLFYYANKVGVDFFFSIKWHAFKLLSWPRRRWPVAVWGDILDIAAISSYV